MFGGLLCGGVAWLLLPLNLGDVYLGSITLHSWRVFLMVSAIPALLGAMLFLVLPESPRFLLEVSTTSLVQGAHTCSFTIVFV